MCAIDRLGEAADFSLSHGAVQLAAEQALSDTAVFAAERRQLSVKILRQNWGRARKGPFFVAKKRNFSRAKWTGNGSNRIH